jgi:hypothetical protein
MLLCYAGAVPPAGVHPLLPTATVHGYSVRHPGLPAERGRDRVHGARPPLPRRPGGRQLLGPAPPSQGPGGLLDHQPSLHWLFCRWDRIFILNKKYRLFIIENVWSLTNPVKFFKEGFYNQVICKDETFEVHVRSLDFRFYSSANQKCIKIIHIYVPYLLS